MKYKLFTYILLISLSVQAQEFAPIGAKWHLITYHSDTGSIIQSNLIQCIDTVLIDGIKWKKILDSSPAYLSSSAPEVAGGAEYFIREDSSGKVFMMNPITNFTFLLFDKNPQIGDIWSYPLDYHTNINSSYYYNGGNLIFNGTWRYRVEAIDTVYFNSLASKRFILSVSPNDDEPFYTQFTTFVFEAFGFDFFTFKISSLNSADLNDKWPMGLRCYEDDYWGLISIVDSVACDSSWLITTSINKINDIGFDLFPNPASNLLNIQIKENQGNVFQMDIVDLQGRKVLSKQIINSMNVQVSISNLKSGMYFINIEQGRRSTTKKFTVLN